MSFTLGTGPKADMNVTPLIAVLFVLLIIFMVATPFSRGEYTDPPQQPQGHRIDDGSPIMVQLTQTKDDDRPTLSINRKPLIKGDNEVNFEYVAQVLDTAHAADVQRVGLIP